MPCRIGGSEADGDFCSDFHHLNFLKTFPPPELTPGLDATEAGHAKGRGRQKLKADARKKR
jgi:hypothetical protein